ncbi:MAG: pyridoxamine 5'-phosphate oxidase family protein, partial [Chloroflexota bacterium]|nr:pyridoxamine 5'-phosphate oxidase family protein [Chloroflexota bacterium]
MAIERSNRPVARARIAAAARELLDASTLCAIATVTAAGRAHINTAYFAWSPAFDIVWMSEPHATHSRILRANDSIAIAVYDSSQSWGKPDRGIQLLG